jgi:hypothetical protein
MSESSWNKDVRGTQVPPLINSDADTTRCVAGPGSGKTFGLVRRVERILQPEGLAVDGHDVLVVAFNRVIARQLRDDIYARLQTFEYVHTRLTGRGLSATQVAHMPSAHRAHAEWTPYRSSRNRPSPGSRGSTVKGQAIRPSSITISREPKAR